MPSSHPLVHSQNAHDGQSLAKPKPDMQNSIQVSHIRWQGFSYLPQLLPPRACRRRKLELGAELGFHQDASMWDVGICWFLNHCARYLSHKVRFYGT